MSRQSSKFARRGALGLSILLVLLGLSMGLMWAQGITGTAVGTVRDATGAAVAGATVTAANIETGIAQSTLSGGAGDYTIPNLAPGRYKLTAQLKGFTTAVVAYTPIQVQQTTRVDFSLRLAR